MPQRRLSTIPVLLAAACLVAPCLRARASSGQANNGQPPSGQTLPSTAPTGSPAPAAPAYQPPPPPPTRHARVQLSGALLTVSADNSSLNQILADIARLTGTTITGGVFDQHIYGTYGPSDPGSVLTELLSGSGSNMLLIETGSNIRQLILTPRNGGPTPPSPTPATGYRDDQDLPPQQTPRNDNRRRFPAQFLGQQLPPNQPADSEQQPQGPPSDGATAPSTTDSLPQPAPANAAEQSPSDAKTPQQIYEQLMRMQQQKDKTNPQ